jgi:hypothetical protein
MSLPHSRIASLLRVIIGLAIIVTLGLTQHAHAYSAPQLSIATQQTASTTNRLVYSYQDVLATVLVSVNLATGDRTTLSDQEQITIFKVTPDGKHVIFQAKRELFVIPIDGGEATRAATGTFEFTITPDSTHIVTAGFHPEFEKDELYVTPIGGEGRSLITMPNTVYSDYYAVSPDSQSIIFFATNQKEQTTRLYAASIAGGDPIVLTEPLGSPFAPPVFTPDSRFAIWAGKLAGGDGVDRVYKFPLQGGTPTILSVENTLVESESLTVTQNGDVLFTAQDRSIGGDALFHAAPSNEISTRIAADVMDFRVSANSSMIVYRDKARRNLFALTLGSTAPIQLVTNSNPIIFFTVSRDGAYAVYTAPGPREVRNRAQVYSVSTAGGSVIQLLPADVSLVSSMSNANMSPENDLRWNTTAFTIATAVGRLIFWGAEGDDVHLYSVPLSGGGALQLSDRAGTDRFNNQAFYLVEDGKQVVYVLDTNFADNGDLHVVNADGSNVQRLSTVPSRDGFRDHVVVYTPLPEQTVDLIIPTPERIDTASSAATATISDVTSTAVPTAVVVAATPTNAPATAIPTAAFSCPNSPPPRLTAGGRGRVTPGDANNLRSSPTGGVIGKVPGGMEFAVIEGPECGAGGRTYWRINFIGTMGWTAEGEGDVYWLEPIEARGS